MTLADILAAGAGVPVEKINAALAAWGAAVPEFKPLADMLSAKLAGAAAADNLAGLKATLETEVENIRNLKLDPASHPADFI